MSSNHHRSNSSDLKRTHHSPHPTNQYRKNSSIPSTPTTNTLNQLDLNYKSLNSVPSDIFLQNENFEKIGLAFNQLCSLPSQFQVFQNLVNLNLRSNLFREIPHVLTELGNLQVLDISRNKIKTLPANPGSLMKLTRLNLTKNRLNTLPLYLGRMEKLEILKVEGNIFSFPSERWFRYEKWSDRDSWLRSLQAHLRETEKMQRDPNYHKAAGKSSSPHIAHKQLPPKQKSSQDSAHSPRDRQAPKLHLNYDKSNSRKNSSTSNEQHLLPPKSHSRSLSQDSDHSPRDRYAPRFNPNYDRSSSRKNSATSNDNLFTPKTHSRSQSQDSIDNIKFSMSPDDYGTHFNNGGSSPFDQNDPPFTSTMKKVEFKPIPRHRSNSHISNNMNSDLIIHESESIDEIHLNFTSKRQPSDLTDATNPTDTCSSDDELHSPQQLFSSALNSAFYQSFNAAEISRLQSYRDLLYVAHIIETRLNSWLSISLGDEIISSPMTATIRSPVSESPGSLPESNALAHSSSVDSKSDKQGIKSNDMKFSNSQMLHQFRRGSRVLCHLLVKCTISSDDLSDSFNSHEFWSSLQAASLELITTINQLIAYMLESLVSSETIETVPQRWKDALFNLHQISIHLKSMTINLQIKNTEQPEKLDIGSILDKVPQQKNAPKVRPFHRKQLSENSLLSKRNVNISPLNKATKVAPQKSHHTSTEDQANNGANNHLYLSVEMGVSAAFKVLNSLKDSFTSSQITLNGKLENLSKNIQRCEEATQSLVGCLNMLFEIPSPNSIANKYKDSETPNLTDPTQLPRFYSHAQHFVECILSLLQDLKTHSNEINLFKIHGIDQLSLLVSSTKEIAHNLPSK
jgi:hypothetical protein